MINLFINSKQIDKYIYLINFYYLLGIKYDQTTSLRYL